MRMSISTTVGSKRAAWATASRPLLASATTSMSGLVGEQHAEAGAHHRLVVGDEDADLIGARLERQPGAQDEAAAFGVAPRSISPPYSSTRSRMPTSPCPTAVARRALPSPSSRTSMRSSLGA